MTVYFLETPVEFIVDIPNPEQKSFRATEGFMLNELLTQISENPEGFQLVFNNHDEMKGFIEREFVSIEAAGGIVVNPENKLLFIFRRGKWDLPKGKKEVGEEDESCARREIEEETGISDLKLKRKLIETYHVYPENGRSVFKTSHWFLYEINEIQHAVPQTEEDITSVAWLGKNELTMALSETYDNIITVVNAYLEGSR